MAEQTQLAVPQLHPRLHSALYRRLPGYLQWRLGYGTFVSMAFRTMYMETPKNACSTTKQIFWKLLRLPEHGVDHVRLHQRTPQEGRPSLLDLEPRTAARVLLDEGYFRFCFLRDPVARLESAYFDKILNPTRTEYDDLRLAVRSANGLAAEGDITFDMFASYVCAQDDVDRDPHWQLQTRLNLMSMIDYQFVGRVERYAADMRQVLERIDAPAELTTLVEVVHNPSGRDGLELAPSVRRAVEVAYAPDFEEHGRR